jgi:hypothetical protein
MRVVAAAVSFMFMIDNRPAFQPIAWRLRRVRFRNDCKPHCCCIGMGLLRYMFG